MLRNLSDERSEITLTVTSDAHSPSQAATSVSDYARQLQSDSLTGAILAAHPDDECVSAGALISHLPGIGIIFVTDGSPRDLQDARNAGCSSREEYAAVRFQESHEALAILGVQPANVWRLGFVDQEASLRPVELTRVLLETLVQLRPGFIMTHPYEGGHPDHDATAFAAHAAARLLEQQDGGSPPIFEFTSYHYTEGRTITDRFIENGGEPGVEFVLTPQECEIKRRVLEAYRTQRGVLQAFSPRSERYRRAPAYFFTRPPQPGPLHYEFYDWGIQGDEWRRRARRALGELGLREPF